MGSHNLLRESQPLLLQPGDKITTSSSRFRSYTIQVIPEEDDTLQVLNDQIDGRAVTIITDHTVAGIHGRRIASWLADRAVRQAMISITPGERSKSLHTAFYLLDELAQSQFGRRDVLIAVGGGVVIDTAGWVASAYMRGIPYINLPTTLLAQVDAAIGGKVAVDHARAKNLIGGFYEPEAVVSCTSYLSTLDPRHIRCGLAEAVKAAVIASEELFAYIEHHLQSILTLDPECLRCLVHGASAIKCRLVELDPYEEELNRVLNFGHAIGHAIETATGYGPVLHGEAVSLGMAVDIRIAVTRGLLDPAVASRVVSVLAAANLPVTMEDLRHAPSADEVIAALGKVRQIRDGNLRFVLPTGIGSVLVVNDVTEDEIRAAMHHAVQAASPARPGLSGASSIMVS